MKPFGIFDTLTVEDYKLDIARFLIQNNSRTKLLIAITLRQVEKQFGIPAINELIKEFDLTAKFGIRKKIEKS